MSYLKTAIIKNKTNNFIHKKVKIRIKNYDFLTSFYLLKIEETKQKTAQLQLESERNLETEKYLNEIIKLQDMILNQDNLIMNLQLKILIDNDEFLVWLKTQVNLVKITF